MDNVTTITTENFTGVRQVRAFRKEEYEVNRFNDETSKLASLQVGLGKISAFLNPLTFYCRKCSYYFSNVYWNVSNEDN